VTPVEVLAVLAEHRVLVVEDAAGRPALDDPGHNLTADTLAVAREHGLALAWQIDARKHGNTWSACDRCGENAIVTLNSGRPDRACMMTAGCKGRHRRPA
jgi:hypothetical protein